MRRSQKNEFGFNLEVVGVTLRDFKSQWVIFKDIDSREQRVETWGTHSNSCKKLWWKKYHEVMNN